MKSWCGTSLCQMFSKNLAAGSISWAFKDAFSELAFPMDTGISGLPGYFCLSSCIAVQVALHHEFTELPKLAKKLASGPKKTEKPKKNKK